MSWIHSDGKIYRVPLAPQVGLLNLICVWVLELNALVLHFESHGTRPTQVKLWSLTGLAVAATVYELTLRRRHKAFDKYIRTGSRLKLSNLHSWVVVAVVLFYLAFAAWIFMP